MRQRWTPSARAASRRLPRGNAPIWALSVLAASLGTFAYITLIEGRPGPAAPFTMPWWVLAGLFFVSEVAVIHIQIRRDSHSLSLSEIPLILGFALATPSAVILGRAVGGGIALIAHRRQGLTKLVFNISLFVLETCLGAAAFRWVLSGSSPVSPRGWLAAMTGIAVVMAVGSLLVSLAILIHDPAHSVRGIIRSLGTSYTLSAIAALTGVLAVIALWSNPWSAVPLAVLGALLVGSLRLFGRLGERHEELKAVHAFIAGLQEGEPGDSLVEDGISQVLRDLVFLMKADVAVAVFGPPGGPVQTWALRSGASVERVTDHVPVRFIPPEVGFDGPVDLRAASSLGPWRVRFAMESGAAAPLREGSVIAGFVAVADPVGARRGFDQWQMALFASMAGHADAAIRRAALVDRLRQQIAENRRLLDSKDELIAAVSHELRTPMTAMLGYSALLTDGGVDLDPDEQQDAVAYIADQTLRLSEIVEDLVVVARAQSDQLSVRAVRIDISAVIQRVLTERGGAEIRVVGGRVFGIGDPARVHQILRNLIENACRYGGEAIRVELSSVSDRAEVAVIDDGEGIPSELVERVFAVYETGGTREVSQPSSLGLGLPLSRELAMLMKGDLSYERGDGETIFRLTLPNGGTGPHVPESRQADSRTVFSTLLALVATRSPSSGEEQAATWWRLPASAQ